MSTTEKAEPVEDEPVPAELATVEPLCADVETWVEHVYTVVFVRKISQSQRWCSQWWAHAEAIVRLTALWRTWESARASNEDSALADWLRMYFDAVNPVLLADDGPFASCTAVRHSEQRPLPLTPPPGGFWNVN